MGSKSSKNVDLPTGADFADALLVLGRRGRLLLRLRLRVLLANFCLHNFIFLTRSLVSLAIN